ncbi:MULTISPECIES: hypothetical protein [unclassified Rhodococcus (in: high G+C Gram-positive bacteria)]|uniref:hypothetical protein n=1 Tax=unclassified Rhodococcus (in: high G+C Gram-positive bacteria) TaxID=192944 RepID=UPI001639C2A4|nr:MULTISPECIES: hypothetical protein [unclassified Rhodococcus (in: high G+C Gram-positive bacteria)]MBC2641961.1 hypothetical protein [Rhodococcus sp. 3A]MBC2893298.1 hypothetical protein [Rhodococcus sp. 4CII]
MKVAPSRLRSSWGSLTVLAVAMTATGCVGAVDRADFDTAMESRGGGMTTTLVGDGLAALAVRYGVDEVQVTSVNVAPVETLDVTVRNPAKPDQLDRFTFDGEWLSDPSPVMVSALEDLDARAFGIGDVPALGRVEALVDDALAHTGFEEGHVTGIAVNRTEGLWPTAMVESPRSRSLVVFDAEGAVIGVQRL